MAIDIRATVTCSLGTLISGSISDDYLQGSGLVKTKGSCEISGLITPAVGTVVTFSYVKGGVTRSIPRKLRVLSSFADPFRRTTKVELGCKLTYLSDLRDPINWRALDDPENAAYDSEDQRIITLPIRASSVMSKCLNELGITAIGPSLTNKFSIAEFDFSSGYVQVLNDLLVSESYFGYLNTSEVLQVVSMDQVGGTGPVFTSADIVDLGPIGVGQLPGEAVTVSYSTLKLKEPENETEENSVEWNTFIEQTRWERSESIGSPVGVTIPYTNAEGATSYFRYEYIPRTVTKTDYETGLDYDRPTRQVTTSYSIVPAIAGNYCSERASAGLSFPTHEIVEETITTYEYRTGFVSASGSSIIASSSVGTIVTTTTIKEESLLRVAGGMNLTYVFSPEDFVTVGSGNVASEKTITIEQSVQNFTRTIRNSYRLWPYTLEGQQAGATGNLNFASSSEVSDYLNSVVDDGLHQSEGIVEINLTGPRPSIYRPNQTDLINGQYADGGDPDNGWRTESSAELELALGSATSQRRIEFSMPYAPDDIFSGPSGGPFESIQSNASAKANRYGRVQNRLLLGNRSGVNLQVAPEKLPVAPFAPLYLKADGLTALYRANGNQWAFDSNGIVCSTDALFWAAVSGTGTFWFPVAPGVTTLPAEPAIVDGEMNATTIVLPYNETARYDARLRVGMVVSKFDYALEVLTTVPSFTVTVGAGVDRYQLVNVPASDIALAAAAPVVTSSNALRIPAAVDIAIAAPVPTVGSGIGSFVSVPAAAITVAAVAPTTTTNGLFDPDFASVSLLLHMDGSNGSTTFTDSSSNALTVTANGNAQISTAQSKFGGASALLDGTDDVLTIPDNSVFDFGSSSFTIEGWIYQTTPTTGLRLLYVKRTIPSPGIASVAVAVNAGVITAWAASGTTSWNILNGVTFGSVTVNTWTHFALVRNGNAFTGYLGGVGTSLGASSATIINTNSSASIGGDSDGTNAFAGYIDELRITKVARYTTNFTPPTAAFLDF
jgi:hypothetical protein